MITIERGTVTDIEGNQYATVKIGDQWWMAENLRCASFNDGSALNYHNLEAEDSLWAKSEQPAYTFINDSIFGYLYNGKVISDSRNIAPMGWHIPTDQEWKTMEETIGMGSFDLNQTGWRGENEGEKLTSKYSVGWPEGGVLFGSDEYGFDAIPGGCQIFDGRTNVSSTSAFWWTSDFAGEEIWYRYLDWQDKRIFRQHTYPAYGMSIRCVKD